MGKDSGYLVETKTGKKGRTYHRESRVNDKVIVHIEEDNKQIKMLCDPITINVIGCID
jgi:hypothetical protein